MNELPATPIDLAEPKLRWWSTTDIVTVDGPDAVEFLEGVCTQHVATIAPDTASYGLFLDGKARILAPALIHRVGGETLLLEVPAALAEPLLTHLKRYRLRSSVTLELDGVSTVGVLDSELLPELPGDDIPGSWTCARLPHTTLWTFLGAPAAAERLRDHVAPEADIPRADPDLVDADRIEAGAPDLVDFTPGAMPAEVGAIPLAVSFDKGCYLGQEPVARLYWRGRPRRTLRKVMLDRDVPAELLPQAEAAADGFRLELRRSGDDADARPIGWLTSWARRDADNWPALAVLRTELEVGDRLVLALDDTVVAKVVDAPPNSES